MSRTKLCCMADDLNELIRQELPHAMREQLGVDVEMHFDLIGSGCMVTRRVDGADFTAEEMAWLKAFETGYLAAMELVGLARDGLPLERKQVAHAAG